jgi:hypothetical protein
MNKALEPIELRFKLEQTPLTYLMMANGHAIGNDCSATDIARAAIYTCCYLWQLAHPDFRPLPGFRDTCREYAHWLLEPGAYNLLTAGATAARLEMNSERTREFEEGFLSNLPARERELLKLQVMLPRGLWREVKRVYGIAHGNTNEGFARLMAAILRQAMAVEGAGDD